ALFAVQLKRVGPERLDDRGERRIVGIDRERDLLGTALHARAKLTGDFVAQVPRRRRKEHEADHIRALIQRHVECLRRAQPAYFDDQTHHRSKCFANSSNMSARTGASLRATLYTIASSICQYSCTRTLRIALISDQAISGGADCNSFKMRS